MNSGITKSNDALDALEWQAWCYVSGEMSETERAEFEAGFTDPVVCEAVARQTELFAGLDQACERPLVVASSASENAGGVNWMARGLMVAAASLLWGFLSLGFWGVQGGTSREIRLGELWVSTFEEEADDGDLLVAAIEPGATGEEGIEGLEVPEWMAVGVRLVEPR